MGGSEAAKQGAEVSTDSAQLSTSGCSRGRVKSLSKFSLAIYMQGGILLLQVLILLKPNVELILIDSCDLLLSYPAPNKECELKHPGVLLLRMQTVWVSLTDTLACPVKCCP